MQNRRLVTFLTIIFVSVIAAPALGVGAGDATAIGKGSPPGPIVQAGQNPHLDARIIKYVHWDKRDGGNNHWYAIIASEMYWEDARALAEGTKFHGKYGYLATITSAEENEFIMNHVIEDTHQPSVLDMFWLGGQDVGGRWTWTTGEPFDYVNWAPTEPNNVGIETALAIWGPNTVDPRRTTGTWNNSLPDGTINSLAKVWGLIEWGRLEEAGAAGTGSYANLAQGQAAEVTAARVNGREGGLLPDEPSLAQNFPNPFNPATEIEYSLSEAGRVRVDVINVLGQVVKTLVDGEQAAGNHTVTWYGTDAANQQVASGMYFYRMQAKGFVATKRMLLLR